MGKLIKSLRNVVSPINNVGKIWLTYLCSLVLNSRKNKIVTNAIKINNALTFPSIVIFTKPKTPIVRASAYITNWIILNDS